MVRRPQSFSHGAGTQTNDIKSDIKSDIKNDIKNDIKSDIKPVIARVFSVCTELHPPHMIR